MRLGGIAAFLLYVTASASPAWAVVATLGASTQAFTLTGIGPDATGQGQAKMTWGSCPYDGTTTKCTLSGRFTGFGGGGTYSFEVSYPGNGAFPLIAVFPKGSNLFFASALSDFSFVVKLTKSDGTTIPFYSFANFNFIYGSPTCTGVGTCDSAQVALTPGATITGPITGAFDPTPMITPNGVITAGNYGAFQVVAPATWMEIYGVNLATVQSQTWAGGDFIGNQAPSALGGTTVTVGGKAAFVDFVSPGQVNVQVPSDVAAGTQPVVVTTAGGSSLAYSVTVKTLEPGLLAPQAFILGGRQHVAALFAGTLTFVLPVTVAGVTTAKARPGDNITLYGIGFGTVTPNIPAGQIVQQANALQSPFQVFFGGVAATVTYAGFAPGYVGLYQINVVVPSVGAGDAVPLTFTLGGAAGPQNLFIAIQ
ncbi:MAG: hypothetical protein ABI806_22670 [Candidatus Solibacter sp.]